MSNKLKSLKKNIEKQNEIFGKRAELDNRVVKALLQKISDTMVLTTFNKNSVYIVTEDGTMFKIEGKNIDVEKLEEHLEFAEEISREKINPSNREE